MGPRRNLLSKKKVKNLVTMSLLEAHANLYECVEDDAWLEQEKGVSGGRAKMG